MKKVTKKLFLLLTVMSCMLMTMGITAFAEVTTKALAFNNTYVSQEITADGQTARWIITVPSDGKLTLTFQTFRGATSYVLRDDEMTKEYYTASHRSYSSGSTDIPDTTTKELWLSAGVYYFDATDGWVNSYAGEGSMRVKASFTSAKVTDQEPNSTNSTAMALSMNTKVRGVLTTLDDRVDFYRIQVPKKGTTTISLVTRFPIGITLYTSDLVYVTDAGIGRYDGTSETKPNSWSKDYDLDPGVYYVKIGTPYANTDSNTGYYDLSWTWTAPKVDVTSVALNKTSLSLTEGNTSTLKTTILPSNATDKTLSWTSSDTSVATVSSSGVVTAKKAGSATIYAVTNDGSSISVSCEVTVKAKVTAPAKVTGLTSTKSTTGSITLKWNKASGATGYVVYKYDKSSGSYKRYSKTTATSLTVKNLSAETRYSFKVAAYKTVSGTTKFGTASAAYANYTSPKKLSATKITSKKTVSKNSSKYTVKLTWKKISGATGYRVYYKKSGGSWKLLKKTSSISCTTTVPKGMTYSYRVAAYRTKNSLTTVGSYSAAVSYKAK